MYKNSSLLHLSFQYTGALEAEKSKWEQKLTDLQQKYDKIELDHKEREQKLKAEIAHLKEEVRTEYDSFTQSYPFSFMY